MKPHYLKVSDHHKLNEIPNVLKKYCEDGIVQLQLMQGCLGECFERQERTKCGHGPVSPQQ